METIDCICVRFDKTLDYKSVVNNQEVKKFLYNAFGYWPKMQTPTQFTFDRDKLGEFIQKDYDKSEDYIVAGKYLPINVAIDYLHAHHMTGNNLQLIEYESEIGVLDDHLVVIIDGVKVLGVFATSDDFGKIIGEL